MHKPKKEDYDKTIKMLEMAEQTINNIEKIKDFEELKNIVSKLTIDELDIIDKTTYNNGFKSIKKEIMHNIIELNFIKEGYKKLNIEKIINSIPAKIKNDNFIDIKELENGMEKSEKNDLNEIIENLKIYNCNIFEIHEFKENIRNINYNFMISNYMDKIKKKFFESNLNFIFIKDKKAFFLNRNMRINLGIYVWMDNMTNEIGKLRIKNNCKEQINYKLIQTTNENLIKANICKETYYLNKYEDLEIKFNILEKRKGIATTNFNLLLYDQNWKESDKCSIEVFIYVIPLILKFSLNNENYNFNKNNNNKIIKINHYIKNFEISYKLPGCDINNGPKVGFHLKTISKEKIGIDNDERGKIKIINNFEINDAVKYTLFLYLKGKNILNFEILYEKPKYFGLILYGREKFYTSKDNCLGDIKILKGDKKEVYLYNMTTKPVKELDLDFDKSKIDIKIENTKGVFMPGKKVKLEIYNINLFEENCNILLKENNQSIKVINLEYPKIVEDKEEIYCKFDEKIKDEIYNIYEAKKFRIFIINKEFKLYIKTINEVSYNCFSAFLIFGNKIVDRIYEEKNYIYNKIDKDIDAFGFLGKKFTKINPDKLDIILKQKDGSIFTQNQREEFKKKINDKFNFIEKIKLKDLNKINSAINFLLNENEERKINLNNFDINESSQFDISKDQTSINNILKFLIKIYFDKNVEQTKKELNDIYKKIYCEREINPYFIPDYSLNENAKIFLDKFAYIISFVSLCVSPGELLENEIVEKAIDENKDELENKESILEQHFQKYIKNGIKTNDKDDTYDEDFIYYEGEIHPNDKKNIFIDYENEINKKVNEKFNYETNEQYFECSPEMENDIINKITNNEINCCNLLIYLKRFEKYIISIPFIFSKEERRKDCITNSQKIYDFMCLLIKSNIYKETEFREIIQNYFDEFEYLLSNFSCFNVSNPKKDDNFEFNFVEKCKLPSDTNGSIIDDFDEINLNEKEIINENKITSPLEQKSYDDVSNSFQDNSVPKRSFKATINNSSIYIGGENRVMEVNDPKGPNQHIGYGLNTDEDSKSEKSENEEKNKEINKNNNDIIINDKNEINVKPPTRPFKIKNAKYDMKKLGKEKREVKERNISAEKMMMNIFQNIESNKGSLQNRFGSIKEDKDIEECMFIINPDLEPVLKTKNLNNIFIKCSNLMKNIIINIIRKKLINFEQKKIYTLENSYIDLTVDISQLMSEQQRISSLIIAIGLYKSLTLFGVNIRISVFGETNNVWLLSDKFENDNNSNTQLLRLKDALNSKKRFQSFPANALVKLKQNFSKKKIVGNYIQILISSLISPQVIDELIDWDVIQNQNIVIFGLKTNFEENFLKELKDEDINNLLNVKYRKDKKSRSTQVSEKLFESIDINKNNLIEGEKDFKYLIEELISKLLTDKEINNNILNKKIVAYKNEEQFDINIIKNYLNDFDDYLKNDKGTNFFAQNKELIFNETTDLYEKLNNNKFPSKEELEKISTKNYSNKNFLEKMLRFEKNYFYQSFNNYFEYNFASGKVFCSSGGTISTRGIKRWVSTGFTNANIFEKKGADDVKKYIISFIIDISKSAFNFNSSHIISTILIMLLAPSIIENNEEIFIDIIINTNGGVYIIDYNAKSEDFQKTDKLNEIINLILSNINKSCCPGSCLYTAYKLLSERKEEEKIFLITDNFITDKCELELTYDLIGKLEESGIDLITIGVGSYPYGIEKIYKKCCYSQTFNKFKECFLICFNNYINDSSLEKIIPSVISSKELTENEYQELSKYISEPPLDKMLEESIRSKPVYILNMVLMDDSMLKKQNMATNIFDPHAQIYKNNIFKTIKKNPSRILIVLLYTGEVEKDSNISEEVFNGEKGPGNILKSKGLDYTIVYNYRDAMDELTINENGHCKYLEAWIFCSDGSGEFPKGEIPIYDSTSGKRKGDNRKITKEDNKKELIPFLETVGEFNRKGGALLLFCDNEPFTLEANLLLSKYLKFEEIKREGANFQMKGNYVRAPNIDKNIYVQKKEFQSKTATFNPILLLPSPGKEETTRLSLGVGVEKFYEGKTLSYAKTNDNSNNFEPFTPFAYLTDKKEDRAFILFYDPQIDPTKEYNRGPIVVHGGYTSAFYEFKEEGTGLLVISIACWLGRIEEKVENSYFNEDYEFFVPAIQKSLSNQEFTDWYKINSIYSILILDVSGSMKKYYGELINQVNSILEGQKEREENEIVIIFFGENAEIKKNLSYKELNENNEWKLTINDITNIKTGDTKYCNAFMKAMEFKEPSKEFILKRLLFFTDGRNNDSENEKQELKKICKELKELNYKLHFFGFGNKDYFKSLNDYEPDYIYVEEDKDNFENIMKSISKQFAT